MTSKNPGRDKFLQKNTKKPSKPNTIIIMTLVASNGVFFSASFMMLLAILAATGS